MAAWDGATQSGRYFSSVAQSCLTLQPPRPQHPGLPVHHQLLSLLELMPTESVMPSNHLILCRPLLFLLSIFPSIRVFSNESALHIRWPKYWSFSFNISPSNEHPGLISFRMDWLDLLAVQGTLTSLLQHHSSKASILWCSAFFIVQLSHPYMNNGKTIALTKRTFVDKVMSLLFNMLMRWSVRKVVMVKDNWGFNQRCILRQQILGKAGMEGEDLEADFLDTLCVLELLPCTPKGCALQFEDLKP